MRFTDGLLARRSLQGDRSAFIHLHRRHARRVFNLLRRLTGSTETAEDLAQETFLAAHRSLGNWRGESAFGTWICGSHKGLAVRMPSLNDEENLRWSHRRLVEIWQGGIWPIAPTRDGP